LSAPAFYNAKCLSLHLENQSGTEDMHFTGLITAIFTFITIGIFHPVVIKAEYHFGTRCWWAFLIMGVLSIGCSLCISHDILSIVLGVFGCSCLWSIHELFQQRERVRKGWFPKNPKRKEQY